MRLYWFELKKLCLSNKVLAITASFIVITCLFALAEAYQYNKKVDGLDSFLDYTRKYEGEISKDTVLAYKGLQETFMQAQNESDHRKKEFLLNYSLATYYAAKWNGLEPNFSESPNSVNYLTRLITKLEKENNTDSYLYRDTSQNLRLLLHAEQPKYYEKQGWYSAIRFCTSTGLILLEFILLAVASTIFSNEYTNNTHKIILSTVNGHRKIAYAKLYAVITYAIITASLFYILNAGIRLLFYGSFKNMIVPLNSVDSKFVFTPYNLTAFQYLFISYFATILGTISLVIMLSLLSAAIKNSVASLTAGFMFVMIPQFTMSNIEWLNKLFLLFPSQFISGASLFSKYISYNLFGQPILYPFLALSACLVLIIGGSWVLGKVYVRVYKV